MSGPLSLRVCCLFAMAPALTDPAVTQTRLKVPTALEASSPSVISRPRITYNIQKGVDTTNEIENQGGKSNITLQTLKELQKGLLKTVGLDSLNIKQIKIIRKIPNNTKKNCEVDNLSQNHCEVDQKMNHSFDTINGTREGSDSRTIRNRFQKTIEHVSHKVGINGENGPLKNELQNGTIDETDPISNVTSTSEMVTSVNSEADIARDDVCDGADVDMDLINTDNQEVPQIKSEKELSDEVKERQHVLLRRSDRILRRLRRLQGRQLETHIRNQTGSYVSFLHRNLQSVAHKSIGISNTGSHSELKAELLKSEDVKSLSTAALVNLVRKIQSTQNQVAMNKRIASQKKLREDKSNSHSVLVIDREICKESSRVAGNLGMNLHHMLQTVDSDATESSSGGESCDEYDDYERECKVPPPPLHRRAEWKWAADRASVASRWTWLQAQVSDLEYRIRQQSEIFKQIRHTKGSVVLGDPPSLLELGARLRQDRANGKLLSPAETKIADFNGSPCNISAVVSNVNRQATKLTQSLGNCLTPLQSNSLTENRLKDGSNSCNIINGVVTSGNSSVDDSVNNLQRVGPSGDSAEMSPPSAILDASCQSARCRPVRSYRKRKLLRTTGLHQVSRKAARLSSVKCHCAPPTSCPMCGGRYNNSQTVDPDTMPINERVSLLDPAYHPVLSFNEEIPLTIHFDALLKSGDWQNKPPPKSAKLLTAERRRQKLLVPLVRDKVRKPTKYAKGAATALLASAKLRNKYERRTPTKGRPNLKSTKVTDRILSRQDLKQKRMANSIAQGFKSTNLDNLSVSLDEDFEIDDEDFSLNFKDGGLSASCPSSGFKELKDATLRKRRTESAYDIDNIVIPYSIASSTRVVKLEYKEIVTPKWRDISVEEENREKEIPDVASDEAENTSDEAYAAMHDLCEIQEKKRFTSFIQYPSRRSRSSRHESGPMTPDTPGEVNVSSESCEDIIKPEEDTRKRSLTLSSSSGGSQVNFAGSLDVFRRRSSSASVRRSSISVGTDDLNMDTELDSSEAIEPWPSRTFPLSVEEYEEMKAIQPPAPENNYFTRARISGSRISLASETSAGSVGQDGISSGGSRPCSPTGSSSAGSHTSEDPNDPEWTMVSDKLLGGERNTFKINKR